MFLKKKHFNTIKNTADGNISLSPLTLITQFGNTMRAFVKIKRNMYSMYVQHYK